MIIENGSSEPLVTIGMPVFNGATTITAAINSILDQTFSNFELVISDNCSKDDTAEICKRYAEIDNRIRYVRQDTNLGGSFNFSYLVKQARGAYFMWAAADDIRSPNFLEVNVKFLSENPEFVASASPNGFENWSSQRDLVKFGLDGDEVNRYITFFNHSFLSHGLFYSLIHARTLRECEVLHKVVPGFDWLGFDWAIILYLAGKGKLGRTTSGYTVFGVGGTSGHPDVYKKFNTSTIEWFLPFYRFSKVTLGLTRHLTIMQRTQIFLRLLKLNLYANFEPIRWRLHRFSYGVYRILIKPLLKPRRSGK